MTFHRSVARTAVLPVAAPHGLLHEIADFFRQFIIAAFDPYRPERHYMRGPGPACRKRNSVM